MRMSCAGIALGAGAVLAGCSATPSVTRTDTLMTPAEIADAGLVCRTQPPIGSNLPRTICASPEAWVAYDRKARLATEELIAKGRETTNVGRFNRD
jgi:hypothetical protein